MFRNSIGESHDEINVELGTRGEHRKEVWLFQQQPPTGTQSVDHPTDRHLRFSKMVEQPSSMNEVKAALERFSGKYFVRCLPQSFIS
jgi:hypothetical protein